MGFATLRSESKLHLILSVACLLFLERQEMQPQPVRETGQDALDCHGRAEICVVAKASKTHCIADHSTMRMLKSIHRCQAHIVNINKESAQSAHIPLWCVAAALKHSGVSFSTSHKAKHPVSCCRPLKQCFCFSVLHRRMGAYSPSIGHRTS